MENSVEEYMSLSDDAGDGGDGSISPTPATVPKKRGRPASAVKPKKASPSTPSRGRGRPTKLTESANKSPDKTAISGDGSQEDGTESDEDSPAVNGDSADGAAAVPAKRGRKPKAKRKIPPIEATGKGRGRPKKIAKPDGDDEEIADDDEGATNAHTPVKKPAAKRAKKGRGRPKKVESDDESSDDKEGERRPLGRPATGAVNLNIVSTGRGQGRPKKTVAERTANVAKKSSNSTGKRGRPVTVGRTPYVATGKPRGRPKMVRDDDEEIENNDIEDKDNGGSLIETEN